MPSSPSPPGVRGRAARVSLSVRVTAGPGSVRVCLVRCEFGRQGQLPGPVLAGAALTASQGRGRASESATTGLEWQHADSVLVGTVLGPFMRLAYVCDLGLGLVTQLAGRGTAGCSLVALQVWFAGPPPYLVLPAAPFLFRCTLVAV